MGKLEGSDRLSRELTEEEKPVALEAFALAFGIGASRAIQQSPGVPEYAKLPADIAERETAELQARLAELTQQHPNVIRRMNLSLESLFETTPVSE